MRIKCEYKTDKFPLMYQMMIVGLIKKSLKQSNKSYYEQLYTYNDKKNKQIKNFTFSVFMNGYKIVDDIAEIENSITVIISTPDLELGINLYNGLLNTKEFKYKSFELKKQRISLIKEKAINEGEAMFKTLSPIAVKNRDGRFIDINNEDYEQEINYIVDLTLRTHRGYGLKEPIKFIPVSMKKVVVKEKISSFKEITNKDIMYVNSYGGVFKLVGAREDLEEIYKSGIGYRRSQGFGNIDLI
ncbi:CRISPR-associated endoribonuclease Cas6 [Clostridium argentinense CDC 2741]|uniref:CRISPR-associated endoribonuclease Cas6 n=1 Tax=Clostridium argentinense CDC 2741 TaxID=1418104 RepID=A0A0C1UMN2_9CLOT|nr:CRISPR-associated endoribonuclease Cas6 [Clostridium argentinense]ARC84875.1 CRISPR-associated endoribonuclease Cas6 [Clostridium argentinense]KIE48470.1 CRISPR-associated endoribonuclease Cas6 [Clostridium argentinense CDC 2741]NFF40749.1 CRISPR-associated endoribonuclease Cas6 [Clostridium argentinense]NFP51903.1 CRISPR-associated endoribonuclease Cas6 [Clostridium argentinense]NFP74394.1 CRISPR-associated endoribonuclease Cas6 [Clostridium argentinense]